MLLVLLLGCLSGCKNDNLKDVEGKVQTFHNEYNQAKFEKIYSQASEEFKKVAAEEGFTAFMHDKLKLLGKYKNSKILFSQEKGGSLIAITYVSVFENYSLAEDFVFKDEQDGQGFKLLQYTLDTGGKIVPVTKTKSSVRMDF